MKMQKLTVRRNRDFTIIPHEIITVSRLSAEARLVHIYLLSRPDNWQAWRQDVMNICNMAKDKYNRVMNELRDHKYVTLKRGGKGGGAALTVFETPDLCVKSGQRKNQLPSKPTTVKQGHIESTEDIQRNNYIESTDKPLCASDNARFDEWYMQYPKKKGKSEARKTWVRKHLDRQADTIIADTIKRSEIEWHDPQYIPMASTYINQERWQDEDFVPRTNGMSKGEARGLRRRQMLKSVDEVFANA